MVSREKGNYPLDVGIIIEYDRGAISYCPVMAHINPDLKEHVASLCRTLIGDSTPQPIGTCFFVRAKNSTGREFDYLVTAKHVYEDLKKAGGPAFLRINRGKVGEYNKGVKDVPIPLKGGWLFHPNNAVDLAVLPKEVIRSSGEMQTLIEIEPHFSKRGSRGTYRWLAAYVDSFLKAAAMGFPWPPIEEVIEIVNSKEEKGRREQVRGLHPSGIAISAGSDDQAFSRADMENALKKVAQRKAKTR